MGFRRFLYFCSETRFKRIGCEKAGLHQIERVEIRSDRSSRLQMFFKTGNLKNFTIFTRNVLESLFLI